MRCKACNVILTDQELKLKDKTTGQYLDLCGECYMHSQEAVYDAMVDNSVEIVEKALDKMAT